MPDDIHGCLQACSCGRFSHQLDNVFKRVEQHAGASSGDVRKQPAFDRVVLGAIAGIVRDADLDPDFITEYLQVVFEDVGVSRIAASAIAQQQDGGCIRVATFADAVPVPTQTVTREQTGVVRQTNIDVTSVANPIVNAMRNEHPVSPAGKVMIESAKRSAAADAARPEQVAQMFFGLGVYGKVRISDCFVLIDETGDIHKLSVTIVRRTTRHDLGNFSQSQFVLVHPVANRIVAHRCSHAIQRF